MNKACQTRLRQGWFSVPPGKTILSHLGSFLYLWGTFFMVQYVCVCVHAILHQGEIPSLVPGAWGPMFVVWKQLHLSERTLGTIQSLLSSAWILSGKQEISQTPRPAEITTTTPCIWPRCLWNLDEWATALLMGAKTYTAKRRDGTSISSHWMMANAVSFPTLTGSC